jgi:hypothetical protein
MLLPGYASPGGVGNWRSASVKDIAEYHPQLALAKLWHVPLVPLVYNLQATFTTAQPTVTQWVTWTVTGEPTRLNQFAVVDTVMFEVDVPSAFAGSQWKGQTDFFYGLQTGIGAQMVVDGAPRYVVAPDYTPIRMLCAMLNENWPQAWILGNTQTVKMQFNASFTLPNLPLTINVAFRMWTVSGVTTKFVNMSDSEAACQLEKAGINMDSWRNSPVCSS